MINLYVYGFSENYHLLSITSICKSTHEHKWCIEQVFGGISVTLDELDNVLAIDDK